MKKDEKLSSIPILVISAEWGHEQERAFFEYGASGYLKKPFDLNDFNEIFEHIEQGSTAIPFNSVI